jgi:hypothetical protein
MLTPDPRDRRTREATRQRLLDGIAAGCAATLLMTALAIATPALAGQILPTAVLDAIERLRGHPGGLAIALFTHLVYGSLAGGLFAVGARRITVGRAILFALGLWAIAALVYAPLVGLGLVAAHARGLAALAIPPHLLYGVALGALTPRGEIVQPLDGAREG